MLFTTYVELDTGEEGRDSDGMSFDCQLSVKFRKKEGSLNKCSHVYKKMRTLDRHVTKRAPLFLKLFRKAAKL